MISSASLAPIVVVDDGGFIFDEPDGGERTRRRRRGGGTNRRRFGRRLDANAAFLLGFVCTRRIVTSRRADEETRARSASRIAA